MNLITNYILEVAICLLFYKIMNQNILYRKHNNIIKNLILNKNNIIIEI